MPDTPAKSTHGFTGFMHNLPLVNYLRDPLHNNAVFLIATYAANALIGFFFWTLAARLYPADVVGQATAMVSAGNLLVMLSGMGMGMGVIRFLAEVRDKNTLINSAFTVVVAAALFLSAVFLLGLDLWSPALGFMHESPWLLAAFILFCCFNAAFGLRSAVFAAFRAARYSLYQSLLVAIKIALLAALVGFGLLGIFGSYTLGVMLAFILANFFMHRLYTGYRFRPALDRSVLKDIFRFTSGNYVGDVLRSLTSVVMPLVVINTLGAEQNAYFYIAWMIAGIFFTVSYSVNISLVAEVTYQPGELRRQVVKALRFALGILVPAMIIVYFLGGFLLSFFGEQYVSQGLWLLRILIISSIPLAVNEVYIAIFRIRKKVLPIMLIYGLISLFTIMAGYLLLDVLGLIGIGIAWLGAHMITMIVILVLNLRHLIKRGTAN